MSGRRPITTLIGVLLMALGIASLISGEVTSAWLWLIAVACAAAGVIGLFVAATTPEHRDPAVGV